MSIAKYSAMSNNLLKPRHGVRVKPIALRVCQILLFPGSYPCLKYIPIRVQSALVSYTKTISWTWHTFPLRLYPDDILSLYRVYTSPPHLHLHITLSIQNPLEPPASHSKSPSTTHNNQDNEHKHKSQTPQHSMNHIPIPTLPPPASHKTRTHTPLRQTSTHIRRRNTIHPPPTQTQQTRQRVLQRKAWCPLGNTLRITIH